MHRLAMAMTFTVALAIVWAGAPSPVQASCAGRALLKDVAAEPGSAVFTGWAASRIAGSQDLVFTVDRWFHGRHAAREVRLLGSTAHLAAAEAGGPVQVALAEATAGDAVSLMIGEPVLMVADWVVPEQLFAVRFCTLAGVPLDSPEGLAALTEAQAAFGRGRVAAELPDTGALPAPSTAVTVALAFLPEWWLPVLAGAFAASFMLVIRRASRRRQAIAGTDAIRRG